MVADSALAHLYEEGGLTIRKIAAQTGVSVHRVRKALLAEGVTFRGSRGRKPSREAILASYRETRSCSATAEALGVHSDTVNKYAKAAGILRAHGGVRRYEFNESFFSEYSAASCYWGGFIAADGGLVLSKGAHRIQILLQRSDRAHIEAFLRCAKSSHPVKDVVLAGHKESSLILSSKDWWRDLHGRFNLTQRKSMTLQPPPEALGVEMTWHYIRGYFDGDGCVHRPLDSQGRVKQIDFTCGSRPFLEWLRHFAGSHHKIMSVRRHWVLNLSGPVLRRTVPLFYAGSTPDTRLARKYERLRHLIP